MAKREAYGCGSTCDCIRLQMWKEDPWIVTAETALEHLQSNYATLHDLTDQEYNLALQMNWEQSAVEEGRKLAAERARAIFDKQDSKSSGLDKKLVKASKRRG